MDAAIFHNFLEYVRTQLAKAAMAFTFPDSFLYWPFLVSALLLTLLVVAFAARAHENETWWRGLGEQFSGRIWWHRSARADYSLYFANALVLPAIFAIVTFGDAQVVKALNGAL